MKRARETNVDMSLVEIAGMVTDLAAGRLLRSNLSPVGSGFGYIWSKEYLERAKRAISERDKFIRRQRGRNGYSLIESAVCGLWRKQ